MPVHPAKARGKMAPVTLFERARVIVGARSEHMGAEGFQMIPGEEDIAVAPRRAGFDQDDDPTGGPSLRHHLKPYGLIEGIGKQGDVMGIERNRRKIGLNPF